MRKRACALHNFKPFQKQLRLCCQGSIRCQHCWTGQTLRRCAPNVKDVLRRSVFLIAKGQKQKICSKKKNTIKTIKFKGCPQAQIYQLNTQRLCQTFYIPKPHIPKAQCVYLYMQEKSCKIEPFFLTQSVNFYRKETPLSGEDGH